MVVVAIAYWVWKLLLLGEEVDVEAHVASTLSILQGKAILVDGKFGQRQCLFILEGMLGSSFFICWKMRGVQ